MRQSMHLMPQRAAGWRAKPAQVAGSLEIQRVVRWGLSVGCRGDDSRQWYGVVTHHLIPLLCSASGSAAGFAW